MVDKDFYDLVNNGVKRSSDNWGTGVILQHPVTNKILLARRTDGDKQYASPGGKVEYQESPKEGILRECREESNVTIKDMCCYDFRTHSSPNGKNWVDFLFYSNNFDDSDIHNQPSEMEEFSWFNVEDALNLDLFPPTKAALKRAVELGLTAGSCDEQNYIPFVDCPSTPSAVQDSCCCAYSFVEPEKIFDKGDAPYLPWD